MVKTIKITATYQDGVRDVQSLEGAWRSIKNHYGDDQQSDGDPSTELIVDHLTISQAEQKIKLTELIQSRSNWSRICFKYSNGDMFNAIVQVAMQHTTTMEIFLRLYDKHPWNTAMDFENSEVQEWSMTGCQFNHHQFIDSLSCELARPETAITRLNLHSCVFGRAQAFPRFVEGLAQNKTLQRLWMPRCGLTDVDIASLIQDALQDHPSLEELGISYNQCGTKGSEALASMIRQNQGLKLLYVNKQQQKMDLEGILQSLTRNEGLAKLNLSGNYVDDASRLEQFQGEPRLEMRNLTNVEPRVSDYPAKKKSIPLQPATKKANSGCVPKHFCSHLSEDETKKLNDSCQHLKAVFLNKTETVVDCSGDLDTILQLGQETEKWLARFLRKAAGGDIDRLRPLIQQQKAANTGQRAQRDQLWKELEHLNSICLRQKTKKKQPKTHTRTNKGALEVDPVKLGLAYTLINDGVRMIDLETQNSSEYISLKDAPVFIDSTSDLEIMWLDLKECERKVVGVDTEWSDSAVATLQLSFLGGPGEQIKAFVIDLMSSKHVGFQDMAKAFVGWLLGEASQHIILGFAFRGDMNILQKYVGPETVLSNQHCLDLQRVMALSFQEGAQLPSLKSCVEKVAKKRFSKTEQCSDWSRRPLSQSQLSYAALDAVVLLVLLAEKKREGKCIVKPPSPERAGNEKDGARFLGVADSQ